MGYYKTAQICLNGHCITSDIDYNTENYCSVCGSATITKCPNCHSNIRGDYEDDFAIFAGYETPKYCHNCGKPFPWTEAAIQAAAEILALDDSLTADGTQILIDALPDLICETPKTKLAVAKFKKLLSASERFVIDGIREFAIDFGCAYVKSELAKLGL